jgi:hypothetical protein
MGYNADIGCGGWRISHVSYDYQLSLVLKVFHLDIEYDMTFHELVVDWFVRSILEDFESNLDFLYFLANRSLPEFVVVFGINPHHLFD